MISPMAPNLSLAIVLGWATKRSMGIASLVLVKL